jgi:hypothetical protein
MKELVNVSENLIELDEYDMFIMLTGKARPKEEREILQFNYHKIKVREERREVGNGPLNSVLGSALV